MTETTTAQPIDLGIQFRPFGDFERAITHQFDLDTADHAMTAKRDDGMYRHLSFRRPGTSEYWFEIVTWPGVLVIHGDMGSYAFSRLTDMFDFFRPKLSYKPGYINPPYWAEKLIAHDGVKAYSEDAFREQVATTLTEWVEELQDEDDAEQKIAGLITAVQDEVLNDPGHEQFARDGLDQFDHGGYEFTDTWEWDLTEYTAQFLWCCHAIVHAIRAYDAAKAAQQPTETVRTVETVTVTDGVL